MSPSRYGKCPRIGLTLLELVVVLGILALLSSMAVRSLQPLADQARYEATQQLIDDMRLAISGENMCRSVGGLTIVCGYAADTGTLPSDSDDLITKPAGLINRTLQTFDSDRDATDDVSLTSGWNGPYLHLGAGQTAVLDGWGRSPALVSGGGGIDIVSQGSDGDSIGNEDGYRANVTASITAGQYQGDVVCRLFDIDAQSGLRIDPSPAGLQQLGVLVYAVNAAGGTTGAIEEQLLPVAASGSFEVRRSTTIQGTIAVRAILWNDVDSDDTLDGGESIIRKSYVHYLQVNPAIDNRVEMELR